MADVDEIVASVRASAKYRYVAEDFIRDLANVELAKHKTLKVAIQATRSKLHQVGGSYLDSPPKYDIWWRQLCAAKQAGGMAALRPLCIRIMQQHTSTRERLPILDRFYAEVLASLPPVQSVLDVACGFNPLSIPWLPLAHGATYRAIDIYQDLMQFIGDFIGLCGLSGQAIAGSALRHLPNSDTADLALLLKAIPCLEQVEKAAVELMLESINARHMLVSFPVRSLGGRSKGMAANYEAHFASLVKGKSWTIQTFVFSTELAFLVSR